MSPLMIPPSTPLFSASRLVVKLSVSDVPRAMTFYCYTLGFSVNQAYTINAGGNYGPASYVELEMPAAGGHFALGLYKDISLPLSPAPTVGTVPSFLVKDIKKALSYLQARQVVIDSLDGQIINQNISDEGYVDEFFFFRDPDSNSLVMRQNMTAKG